PMPAQEERRPQPLLELADLLADRRLGQRQLPRGRREAEQPRRRFEGDQVIQRRQLLAQALHKHLLSICPGPYHAGLARHHASLCSSPCDREAPMRHWSDPQVTELPRALTHFAPHLLQKLGRVGTRPLPNPPPPLRGSAGEGVKP